MEEGGRRREKGGGRRNKGITALCFFNNDFMGSILDFDHFWNGVSLTSRVPRDLHVSFKSMKHTTVEFRK